MSLLPVIVDKPAWLDHNGRPQQTMKISDSGMGSHVLRGRFSDKKMMTILTTPKIQFVERQGIAIRTVEEQAHAE